MPFVEALKLALSSILGHKLRSFLTLLGVIFGVATVIVVVSLVEGFNTYVDEKIANIGTNAFAVQRYSLEDFSSVEALNAARRRNRDVSLADLEVFRRARGGVIRDVAGKEDSQADLKRDAISLFRVQLIAATHNVAEIEKIEAAEGRYLSKTEEDTRRTVCFIGSEVAEKLFPTGSALDQTIKVDGRPFQVVGDRPDARLGFRPIARHVRHDSADDVHGDLRFAAFNHHHRRLEQRSDLSRCG